MHGLDGIALRLLRQQIRRAILAGEKPVGLCIADEPLGRAVERHRSSEPVGDVPEMAQCRREMAFLDRAP